MNDFQQLCHNLWNGNQITEELIKKVVDQGEVNQKDQYNKTPLFLAIEKNHWPSVKLLLDNHADMEIICGGNKTSNQLLHEKLTTKEISIADFRGLVRPRIFVNTALSQDENNTDAIYKEIDKYSITPTTFRSRSFKKDTNDTFFQDKYVYKGNSVVRFGINVNCKKLQQKVKEHNAQFIKKLKDSEVISLLNKSEKSSNPESLTQKKEKLQQYIEESKDILTDIEKCIVNEAINYLNAQEKKTVLVEVFERDTSGKVKDSLSPHTVVLYRQNDKYLVIDPSNAEFSTILISAHEHVVACFNKKFKIYQPIEDAEKKGLLGSKVEQWRDCVDIAVKLAFNLNKNDQAILLDQFENLCVIRAESLKSNTSIQEVSNNPDTYKKVPEELKYYSFRLKQSSNIIEQKKTTESLKILGSLSKKVTTLIETNDLKYAGKKLQQQKENIFKKLYSPEQYYTAINDINDFCKSLSEVNEVSLLAESMQNIDTTFNE